MAFDMSSMQGAADNQSIMMSQQPFVGGKKSFLKIFEQFLVLK